METINLKMTYERCEAVYQFIEQCLALDAFNHNKSISEKLINVLMWKVRNKFRSKVENNRDTTKCNVSLELDLALAFHEYFTNHCPLECPPYPGATINAHVELIDKKHG
jgi:hypothetical protein